MTDLVIRGEKGSKQRTPVEAPNTLRSIALARILDLVSEGEIVGLVDGLKSVYLDETPVQNADGSYNFQNVQLDYRYGSQDQSPITGFPSVENELGISVELKSDTPYSRNFTNTDLTAVRVRLSVPALSKQNTENGDLSGYNVSYVIEVSKDGGPFVVALSDAFNGKTMSKYERSHRIELPPAESDWTVRVRRTTPNATTANIQDKTFIESMTEIIDAKLRYPNSALMGIMIDASQFQSIPSRAYDLKGRIIRVPTNYSPDTRTYTGVWNGTYKLAWTDNPAWIYLDLVTHPRYGLGHLLTDAHINKWELYRIAQYCDQSVPDGKGGFEPRFACNLFLQSQADAYKVIQDLATVFRGMAYWADGMVTPVADMPEDPVYTYSPANVVGGKFTYSGSARKVRHTVALVTWSDPDDFGRTKVEYVDDQAGIARYGIQQTDMIALGCTSQGQAQRLGRYLLATANYETQTVSFQVGLDGSLVAPGKIVRIADPLRTGSRLGGRVKSATNFTVTFDSTIQAVPGDTLTCVMADGVSVTRTIASVAGDFKSATVTSAFPAAPAPETMWAIDRTVANTQRYRILSIEEAPEGNAYTVSAVQHVAGKFDYADTATKIDLPPTSMIPLPYQMPPASVSLSSFESAGLVTTSHVVQIAWEAAPGAVTYQVEYKRDDNPWISLGDTSGLSIDLRDAWAGNYYARVRAKNAGGILSIAKLSNAHLVGDQTMTPGFMDELVGELISMPNLVTKEELVEITQHMMTLATIAYEDAEVSAGAKYDVARSLLELEAIDAKVVSAEISIADQDEALAQTQQALGARIDDAEALILNEQTARVTADEALAQSITALEATVNEDIAAQLLVEQTARVEGDTAITETLELLGAKSGDNAAFILNQATVKVSPTETLGQRLDAINTSIGDTEAQLANEQTIRANADSAIVTDMSLLGAKSGDNSSWILDMTKVKVDATTSLGVRLTTMDQRMNGIDTSIATEQGARIEGDTAIVNDMSLLGAKSGPAGAETWILDMNRVKVDATTTIGVRLSTIDSAIAGNTASITNEASTRASADSAISSNVSTLTTTVNGHTTTISSHTTSINGLSGKVGVTIDANGYLTGWSLNNNGNSGSFVIRADTFQIIAPGGGARTEYSGGNWRVYDGSGVLRVRMGVW